MIEPSYIIRPPHSVDELTEHIAGYVEIAQSFSPEPLPEDTATRLLQKITTFPDYWQEQVRSAYRNGEQLGGYRIYERQLCVGVSRIATGCVGGVYTCAEARMQGVATALMPMLLLTPGRTSMDCCCSTVFLLDRPISLPLIGFRTR